MQIFGSQAHLANDSRYEKYGIVTRNGCVVAAIEVYPPYTTINGTSYGGDCLSIFNMIMRKLGFCYTLIRSPDHLFGSSMPNGSWNGIVGLLQRKEAEVVVCPIARTYQRYQVIDFSEHVSSTAYGIIYPRPTIQPNYLGFVMPFSAQVWIAIAAIVLLITIITQVIKKKVLAFGRENKDKHRKVRRDDSNLSSMWVYKGLLSQPITRSPQDNARRILMAIWLVLALVIGMTYKCNLNALIIVPKVDIPFNSLEGLVNQNQFKWSFLTNSIVSHFLKLAYQESPNSVMGRAWAGKSELYKSPTVIKDLVLSKKMACIEPAIKYTAMISEDFSMHGKCRYALAAKSLFSADLCNGLRKGSRMHELINPYIIRLREAGLLNKILREHEDNSSYCSVPPGKEVTHQLRAFEIVDFAGMFSILLAGYLLAALVLICELFVKRLETTQSTSIDEVFI